ncbi:MAG: hypothetical protein QOG99_3563 [Frankiales bacterium]|jgi:hypothetical protein|nr:hypothetical protein [Frankiales bacterium]
MYESYPRVDWTSLGVAHERARGAYQAAREGVYDQHPSGYTGGWTAAEWALLLELGQAEEDLQRLRNAYRQGSLPPLPLAG